MATASYSAVTAEENEIGEIYVCDECKETVDSEDNLYELDGVKMCTTCFDNLTINCHNCGKLIWLEDNEGDIDIPLCHECYEENYTICSCCGRVVRIQDVNYPLQNNETPYCNDCNEDYDYESCDEYVKTYNYKPYPIFYGEGGLYMGVELEIDGGGKDDCNAEKILKISNKTNDLIYIKSDSSLNDGLEIVTHPMTLEYHMKTMPWKTILNECKKLRYLSHSTDTCGLHVHVNRNYFGSNEEKQDECISRILYFVETNWTNMVKFSRRTERQLESWANRYGYKDKPKEILNEAKSKKMSRYTCVNILNNKTIEFRMFRGTLVLTTLKATLQLVESICSVAFSMSDEEISNLTWYSFVNSIEEEKYPELIRYLKIRKL